MHEAVVGALRAVPRHLTHPSHALLGLPQPPAQGRVDALLLHERETIFSDNSLGRIHFIR